MVSGVSGVGVEGVEGGVADVDDEVDDANDVVEIDSACPPFTAGDDAPDDALDLDSIDSMDEIKFVSCWSLREFNAFFTNAICCKANAFVAACILLSVVDTLLSIVDNLCVTKCSCICMAFVVCCSNALHIVC